MYFAQNFWTMKSSRSAIIDLGTNTFHLLIIEFQGEDYNLIFKDRVTVKIGKDGITDGFINDLALQRALKALKYFSQEISKWKVKDVNCVATSAFRNAKNKEEVLAKIKAETGFSIEIISGEKEAEYIYYGVKTALDVGKDPALIMDIGGGSVEFIIGNRETISWKQSFEIGAQRLLDKFHKHDPISHEDINRLEVFLVSELAPLLDVLSVLEPVSLIGSSGTFDTLSDIFCAENDIDKSPEATETPLEKEAFLKIHDELMYKNRQERLEIPGMIEMRVDMIVVASCIIHFLLKKHDFQKMRVSTNALKEGVLYKMLENKNLKKAS